MKALAKTGVWFCDEEYDWEELLAKKLTTYLRKQKAKEIADIGCGEGRYVDYWNKRGFKCDGYDGNFLVKNKKIIIIDFTKNDKLNKVYDWLISLEVAEHIPKKFEDKYVNLLHKHNKDGIIISWSNDKNNGDGHVNVIKMNYVYNLFTKLGYVIDYHNEDFIRKQDYRLPYWHNLFIFKKNEKD